MFPNVSVALPCALVSTKISSVSKSMQVKTASSLEQNYMVLCHSDLNISVSHGVPQCPEPHSCG